MSSFEPASRALLEDGTYDVIIVDAEDFGDEGVAIEFAVSSGAHRGEVVRLRASNVNRSWFDLLAAPATLIVTDGVPDLRFD
jgi:hypothetical protein